MQAGLNLFSICNLLQTEEGYIDTLIKLKEMGYSYVQFSGVKYNPELIKRGVEESGLPVVLTHVPIDMILGETEKLVEEHLSFGCKNIGLGAIPNTFIGDDNEWRKKVDELNEVALKIKGMGCKFFYHHHQFEFFRMDNGQTVMDYMIENAPNVNFTLDSYWLQYSGIDPVTFAKKVKGRMDCVHLKDYKVNRLDASKYDFKPNFAPVGGGNLDFKSIIKSWKKNGAKYFIVEQDDASSYADPLEQAKISIDYLKRI